MSAPDMTGWTISQLVEEVSKLRRRIEALTASRDKYRSLIEDQPEFVSRYTPDGTLTFVNAAYARQHGFSPDEMIGKNFFDFVPPEEVDRMRSHLDNLSPHRPFDRIENQAVMPDGALRWQEWTDRAFFDESGSVVELQAFGRDITDRKIAEHELRGSEDRFSRAQRIGHIGNFEHLFVAEDYVDDVLAWSDETCRIFGLDPERDTVTATVLLSRIHPNDRAQTKAAYDKAIAGAGEYACDYRILHPSGDMRFVHERGEVAFDSDGRPVRSFGTVQDITERKQSEEALAESEARLAEAQRIGQIGSWELEVQSGQERLSDECRRILCFDSETDESDFERFKKNIHPEDRSAFLQARDRALYVDQSFDQEFRYVLPDGAIRHLHSIGEVTLRKSGMPMRMSGTVQDITERKQTEEALRERDQNLRGIMANIADSVVTIDEAGRILSINKAAEQAFGYSADEIVGGKVEQLMPEPHAARHHQYIASYLATGHSVILGKGPRELAGRHKDGSPVPIELAISEVTLGERRTFIGTMRDISQRKLIEEALAESEASLAEAQQIANIGSWVVHVEEGRLTKNVWSDQLCRIFGIWHDGIPQSLEAFLGHVHEEDRHLVSRGWAKATESNTPYDVEHRIVRPDGEVRFIRSLSRPFADEAPGVRRLVGVTTDVTEGRLAEEQLRQAQKMEAVGQLTGGVAHDFNNLLAVMLGNLELLRDHVAADVASNEMIDRGVKAAERGADLTSRLLAFSRKQTLSPTSIDLNKIVSGTSEMLRRTLEETIKIHITGQKGLWLCHADQPQLENALLNLSINARDAMPEGGLLTIETANILLNDDVATQQADLDPGEYVSLSVTDTGIGIESDAIEHVFEPFFTTKGVGEGSGLGLSMVYGFAKQSNGAVTIQSEPGEGTTVKLYLPRAVELRDETHTVNAISEIPMARGESILVVEDDAEVRQLTADLLSALGYEVAEAGSAEAALDVLNLNSAIDLLLSDVVLPGAMNGPELTAEVRRRNPNTKILYMTGYAREAFNSRAERGERSHVIQKPFKKADLGAMIRRLLDGQ